jgi:iron complex transport system substrate-binding protein
LTDQGPRICSLLPSATEIVYALGLGDRLVGVTHECDFPPEAAGKPRVTSSIIDSEALSSGEIDRAVRDSLEQQSTIYHLDRDLLNWLCPDVVLTQELCDVCAVGFGEVRRVVESIPGSPRVVSLEPRTLSDVLDSILVVGRLGGALERAVALHDALARRLIDVRAAAARSTPVRVLTVEWVDPVFVGGHWVPEMVGLAGGVDVLGVEGEPSREVSWVEIARSEPEVVVVIPCGFDLARALEEIRSAPLPTEWHDLAAVRNSCVFAVDGSAYFSRPGPRLVDGVEILASILHPEAFCRFPEGSWERV